MIINTLIIEDHPIIIEANKIALKAVSKNKPDLKFKISTASNSDSAVQIIENSKEGKKIDLVFLDIRIDPSKDKKILSGEDLGLLLRKTFDDVKIIVITTFNNNFRLNSILRNIDPDALMIKTELTPKNLVTAIENIIEGGSYYCSSVSKLMRKLVKNDIVLDDIDRKILHELSIGTKMGELPDILPLSISGVERRKRILNEVFNVPSRDDRLLIQKARESGFI